MTPDVSRSSGICSRTTSGPATGNRTNVRKRPKPGASPTLKIPQDIYDSVFDLATRLVASRESGDTKAFWTDYNELRQYCEAQQAAGRSHPFLWETLADFTDD